MRSSNNVDFGTDNFRGYCDGVSDAFNIFGPPMIKSTIKNGQRLSSKNFSGKLVKPKEEVLAMVREFGGKLWYENIETDNDHIHGCFIFDNGNGFLFMNTYKGILSVEAMFVDDTLLELANKMEKEVISKDKTNTIYAVVKTPEGLVSRLVGNDSSPLIRDNYAEEVVKDYDRVIRSFKEGKNGRIVILQGSPGSGKTYLSRALISDLDFISLLIPASLVSELDGPDFLPLLLDINHSEKDKPILIIIEDGDNCLISRENDNMSAISSLLNMSDGILGNILDIRIVVSTNAQMEEIDKAILRPGRLCAHMFVDPLPYEKCVSVVRRIAADANFELPEKRDYILAELYALANDKELYVQETVKKKPIGFGK